MLAPLAAHFWGVQSSSQALQSTLGHKSCAWRPKASKTSTEATGRSRRRARSRSQASPKPHTFKRDRDRVKDAGKLAEGAINGAGRRDALLQMGEDVLPSRDYINNMDDDPDQDGARFMDAVVKVYCVHTEPNYSLPWQRKRQYASTSSGFMVAGPNDQRWLLTNAHSVEYHSQVKVKRRGDEQKFLATVLAIGTECDIALLTVADDAFWEGVAPLQFGALPKLQDGVAVVGYPIGGDTISVTSGVVSRIEVTSYVHGSTELLGVQIDAAINSGNSGGPVFNGLGQCVGIAFQSMAGGEVENIGYVIPTPVIHHFLTDYQRNGAFTGFPTLGIKWQRMESAGLRASYGLGAGRKGVLVRAVGPTSPAAAVLRPDDVIMRFDGVQVACDGTVPFRTGERIAFGYLISQKYVGESVRLGVMRDGQALTLDLSLVRPQPLVPLHLNGRDPSYFVIAGLVLTPACEPYLLSEYGSSYIHETPVKLLDRLLHCPRQFKDEEVVLLSQVLACDAALGYEELFNIQVHRFNGTPVQNLRHLVSLVHACTAPFLRFDLEYDEVVVLDRRAAEAATSEVLELHSIPAPVSKDLLDLLPRPALASVAAAAIAPGPQDGAPQPHAAGSSKAPSPAGNGAAEADAAANGAAANGAAVVAARISAAGEAGEAAETSASTGADGEAAGAAPHAGPHGAAGSNGSQPAAAGAGTTQAAAPSGSSSNGGAAPVSLVGSKSLKGGGMLRAEE